MDASRDQNFVPTLLAVSSIDGRTPVVLWANPVTHRLLTDTTASNVTLAEVSAASTDTAKSLYTMTAGVVPEFRGEKLTVTDNVNSAGGKNIILSSPLAIGTNDVILGNGYGAQPGATFPVPYFRPVTPNSRLPFDLMPNTEGLGVNQQLDVWMDICSTDFVRGAGSQQEFMRVGYNGSAGLYGLIGTNAFNTGTVRPIVINPYGGNIQFGYPNSGGGDGTGSYFVSVPMSTTAGGAAFHAFQVSSVVASYASQGTYNSPAASTNAGSKPYFMGGFYNGSAYVRTANIHFETTAATMSTSDQGTDAVIETTKTGTTTRNASMWISNTGTQVSNGGGAVAPNANTAFQVKQTNAQATGALGGIVYTGAVNTNQTASTEISSLSLTTAGRQWATGSITLQRETQITQPTYSFVGASVMGDAATISILGNPIAGTNATINQSYGILVEQGAVGSGTGTSFGMAVNAQTGATNFNHAAAFLNGAVLVGSTTSTSFDAAGTLVVPNVQVVGTGAGQAMQGMARFSATPTAQPRLALAKSAGSSIGSFTAVGSTESLGYVSFQGSDGTRFVEAATINGQSDGTVSSLVVPGRIILSTASSTGVMTPAMYITSAQNTKIGASTPRSTTEGTNQVVIFNGTAPVGTLANGASFYAAAGEMRVMDAAGASTLLSPHDDNGDWVFYSKNTKTGKVLHIEMEKMMKYLNDKFGTDFVHEYTEDPEVDGRTEDLIAIQEDAIELRAE